MAQFISVKYQQLLAMATAGQIVAGNLYYADEQNPGQLFLAVTGTPNPNLFPMSSLILTGQYELAWIPGPAGADGATGATGADRTTGTADTTCTANCVDGGSWLRKIRRSPACTTANWSFNCHGPVRMSC